MGGRCGRKELTSTELRADRDDGGLVDIAGAVLVGAVTDPVAKVHVLAEALNIAGGGAAQAGGQVQHVVDAGFLEGMRSAASSSSERAALLHGG